MILGAVMRRNPEGPSDRDKGAGAGGGGRGSDAGRGGGSGGSGPGGFDSGGSGNGGPRTIIVGCGRVGAELAGRLCSAGHDVTIIDVSTNAFNRLPEDFAGQAIRGDGTDEDVLRRAGAEGADQLFALTEGDNRNVLVAQLAAESLGVHSVVAKVNDPVRADAYAALGIPTICRTRMLVDAMANYVGLAAVGAPTGVMRPTGQHPGDHGDHRPLTGDDSDDAGAAPPASSR